MAEENWLWGQKRIQAELARLGFKVSARTVAKYMRAHRNRGPPPGWRKFLKQHAPNIWAFRNGPVVVNAWTCRTLPSILSGCLASEVEPPQHLAAGCSLPYVVSAELPT
jgi:hypothetical protein